MMTRAEFQSRMESHRRMIRPLVILYLIYVFSGPFVTWPWLLNPVLHWVAAVSGSEPFALWLTIMLLVGTVAAPVYVFYLIRWRYGLLCPKCHHSDRHGRYISGVLADGHCPHCKAEVLDTF